MASDKVWRKSRRSAAENTCVELSVTITRVDIRDSKRRAGGMLTVAPDSWSRFLDHVKMG